MVVVSNPEFLREGAAIGDFKRPDRVVIGVDDLESDCGARARAVMAELYRPLNLNESPLLFVERRTSELIKYAANAFLAMKITFINEMADLCEKVDADDMRDSPALDLVPALAAAGATVRAFDPEGMEEAGKLLKGLTFVDDPYEALAGADAAVIVTEWDQFRALDLDWVKLTMARPVMVALRNVYRPDEMRARGFDYSSIGRA